MVKCNNAPSDSKITSPAFRTTHGPPHGFATRHSFPNSLQIPADTPAVLGWDVRCEVHELFTPQDVENIRRQFPQAARKPIDRMLEIR